MHTVIPAEISHDFGKATVTAFKIRFQSLLTGLHNKIRGAITIEEQLASYNELHDLFFKNNNNLIDYDEADIGLLILGLLTKTPGQTSRVVSTSDGVRYQLGAASNIGGTCPDFSNIINGSQEHRPIEMVSDADAAWSIKSVKIFH